MLANSEIKGLALTIEEEMFKCFKDTDHKYKAKYRSLVFNIKDHKNKVNIVNIIDNMSRVVRKPAFCICENKDADYRKADQRLCFRYTDSTIPLLPKSEILSFYPSSVTTARFLSDLVGNPEDRFSHDEAHMSIVMRKPVFLHMRKQRGRSGSNCAADQLLCFPSLRNINGAILLVYKSEISSL